MEIKIARSEQACALGAAMFAAVNAGVYPNVQAAQKAMGNGFEKTCSPIRENSMRYAELYQAYHNLGEYVEKRTVTDRRRNV
jgi:L-ribulokinase